MPRLDLPLEELRSYRPDRTEPEDFEEFWARTLEEARAAGGPTSFVPFDACLTEFDVVDVRFPGFAGQPIAAWLILPRRRERPLPCIVEFLGYGGGRGHAFERLVWPAAGYAYLVMDNRGQGAHLSTTGITPDEGSSAGPQAVGYSTRGILSHEDFYFRRLYADGVRAVDAVREHPAVDPARVVVAGKSLGGGTALAVAGLTEGLAGALVDVPALCHPRRAMEVVEGNTYREIRTFLRTHRDRVEDVFRTLSYVDGMNFAVRARTPALFSAALMDDIVPPSSVFAAYNYYAGPKEIAEWPFNGHEAGGPFQTERQLGWLRDLFAGT